MSCIDRAIKDHERILNEELTEADGHKRRLDILIELKKRYHDCVYSPFQGGEQPTEKEKARALSLLCWGDLAGCCAPGKGCTTHLAVCEFLGVDPEEVYSVKVNAVKKVLEK